MINIYKFRCKSTIFYRSNCRDRSSYQQHTNQKPKYFCFHVSYFSPVNAGYVSIFWNEFKCIEKIKIRIRGSSDTDLKKKDRGVR